MFEEESFFLCDLPSLDLLLIDEDEVRLFDTYGDEVNEADMALIKPWTKRSFSKTRICPHCHCHLERGKHSQKFENTGTFQEPQDYRGQVLSCKNCSYWQIYWRDYIPNGYHAGPAITWLSPQDIFIVSNIKQFNKELPYGIQSELAVEIRRKQRIWHELSPKTFEELVASIFKANHSDCEVLHIGRPDDGGVDVIFVDAAGSQWLIQCKCRQKKSSSEGVETLRNLLGAMLLADSTYGIVASTADHFTYRALQAKKRAREVGYFLRLLDRGKLNRMLDPLLPDRPWLKIIEAIEPKATSRFASLISKAKQLSLPFDDI